MTTVCSIGLTFLGDRESASPGSLIADLRHDASVSGIHTARPPFCLALIATASHFVHLPTATAQATRTISEFTMSSTAEPCRILDLPAEIRNAIYAFALSIDGGLTYHRDDDVGRFYENGTTTKTPRTPADTDSTHTLSTRT
jgi:hypothetical protein